MTEPDKKPRKSRRNTRACDQCSKRSVKCRASTEDPSRCQNCVDFDELCAFDRPTRKRAGQSAADALWRQQKTSSGTIQAETQTSSGVREDSTPHCWIARFNSDVRTVSGLIDVFFEVIFPVFPLFHKASLKERFTRGDVGTNAPFSAAITALCALVSARVRDGAVYSSARQGSHLEKAVTSETFFKAADEALPRDAALTQHLGYMQTCVLLALTSIQYGNSTRTQYYLSMYHTFVAVGCLHDEEAWPKGLGQVELEERRRLFWSTYTLDVFTSVIWKRPVRGGEAGFNVSYPSADGSDWYGEPAAADFTTHDSGSRPSWLVGWNFVTDLYRILEHVLRYLHPPRDRAPALHLPACNGCHNTTALLEHVMARYHALPPVFKTTSELTYQLSEDLFSFQAANIAATVQLVRMVLFTAEGSSVEQKCQIAGEVISAFAQVPTAYLRAISAPLLHHLSGIGMILGSTFREKLSEGSYSSIRTVLLDLATLIEHLEAGMHTPAGTSAKLRAQVTTIDEHWNSHKSSQTAAPDNTCCVASGLDHQVLGADELRQPMQCDFNDDSIFLPPQLLDDWSWVFDLTQDYSSSGG